MLRALPKGWEHLAKAGRAYDDRGWTTCESSWAALVKDGHPGYWNALVNVGKSAKRPAPVSPESMARLIAQKRFTSAKADLPMVRPYPLSLLLSPKTGPKRKPQAWP